MNLLVALFALAAFVWMIPIIHRGRLLNIAMIVLLTGTVFGPLFFAIDGPIQFSLDRLLWLVMLGLLVVQWRLGNVTFPKLMRIDWLLLALALYLFVSALRGGPVPTGSSPIARWMFYFVMPLGTYFVARAVQLRIADLRLVFHALIGLGFYLAATGLLELGGLDWAVFPKYITDPDVWKFYGRARGPLMNPIGNGILIAMALVAAVIWFFRSGRRGKLVYGTMTLLLFGGVYATLTRSCWIGAIGAVGMLAMIYSPRSVRALALASVVLLAAVMASGSKEHLVELKRDKALSAAESAKSIELRPLLAVIAWEMFKDHPIIGHGFGHYFEHNAPYHDIRSYELPLDRVRHYAQHNTFLTIAVDGGLIGIGMFTGFLLILFGIGWRLARDSSHTIEARCVGLLVLGTLVVYGANAMFHDLIVIPMVQMFLLFVAGLAVTALQKGVLATELPEKRLDFSLDPPTQIAANVATS